MKPKSITSSKTIRVGTVYISAGFLVIALQVFDVLEVVLSSIDAAENIPAHIATWAGLILAIIGGVQIWLRMVTTQPIGNSDNQDEAE